MSNDEYASSLVKRWELADPRDRWRQTGRKAPPHSVRNSDIGARSVAEPQPYTTPQSTIDAFWYLIKIGDLKRLNNWLRDHPYDAEFLVEQAKKGIDKYAEDRGDAPA